MFADLVSSTPVPTLESSGRLAFDKAGDGSSVTASMPRRKSGRASGPPPANRHVLKALTAPIVARGRGGPRSKPLSMARRKAAAGVEKVQVRQFAVEPCAHETAPCGRLRNCMRMAL